MKKVFLVLVMAILSIGIATAQNANRTGFFMELGMGGLVGNTPRSSITITDNVMYSKCLSGAALDFSFGGRIRIKSHWAYEFIAEAQMPITSVYENAVVRFLPVGFRYTSREIWRNYSLYVHFNVGGAMNANSGIIKSNLDINYDRYGDNTLFENMDEIKLSGWHHEHYAFGAAYSLGIGVNITTHFYVEGSLRSQMLFNCYGKNGKSMLNYGVLGVILGYRF